MFFVRRRRLRGDMIEVFKMIEGIDLVDLGKLFCMRMEEQEDSFCLKIRRRVNSNIGLNNFTRSY